MKTLRMLSNETGAKTYNVRVVGDGAALSSACSEISRELRQQYTVGFVAPDPGAGGYRGLRVDVPARPGVDVRVRKGVEVGSRSPPVPPTPEVPIKVVVFPHSLSSRRGWRSCAG